MTDARQSTGGAARDSQDPGDRQDSAPRGVPTAWREGVAPHWGGGITDALLANDFKGALEMMGDGAKAWGGGSRAEVCFPPLALPISSKEGTTYQV